MKYNNPLKNRDRFQLTVFFLLIALFSFAQENRLEELHTIWSDTRRPYIERLDAIEKIIDSFELPEEADSTIYYGLKALEIAKSNGNDTFQIKILKNLGKDYGWSGKMDDAKIKLEECIQLATQNNYPPVFQEALGQVSLSYAYTKNLDHLDSYLMSVVPQMVSLIAKDTLEIAKIYRSASEGYSDGGRIPQTIYWLLKAQSLLELTDGNEEEKKELFNDLSYAFTVIQNFEKAKEYAIRSMQIAQRQRDSILIK